jgi:phosphatidylglycerophosphate synthase
MNHHQERPISSHRNHEVLDAISPDRKRTNLLRKPEQNAIAWLVQQIPSWVSSNLLTAIGFSGSAIVFLSFILATYLHVNYLLLGVFGFIISWFGDSLDGRIAYYRKKPRKWYGFALDITFDWIGIILIGCGFIVYAGGKWELLGYGFIVMYGWEMIIALMRYKITGHYSIDSGFMGPTEVRILISAMLAAEVLFRDSILYAAAGISIILFFVNILDTRNLLKLASEREKKESNSIIH